MVEGRGEISCWISVVEVFPPTRLASVGMDQCVPKNLQVARVDEATGRSRHMGLAVHGRKCGDIPERADRLGPMLGEMGLTAVFDDLYAVCARDLDDFVDLACETGRMDDHGCGNVLCYALCELFRADIVTVGLAIHEPRLQYIEHNGSERAGIRDGRDEHFTAFRQIERGDGNIQGGGAGRDRICVTAAHHIDESVGVDLLKRSLIARINFALGIVVEHCNNLSAFVLAECEARRHGCLAHRLAPVNCKLSRICCKGQCLDGFVHARPTRCEICAISMPWALSRSSWLP